MAGGAREDGKLLQRTEGKQGVDGTDRREVRISVVENGSRHRTLHFLGCGGVGSYSITQSGGQETLKLRAMRGEAKQ